MSSAQNMAFRVEITEAAQAEADEILNWLAVNHAGDAGLSWFRALSDSIASLSTNPHRCGASLLSSLSKVATRQLYYGRGAHTYRILFTISGDTVYILHIRHGRRRIPPI